MKSFSGLFKKLNNRGVSLVELISAMAILSIIGISIAGIMVISSNAYSRGVIDVDAQQEAQFAANLIGSYVKDASEVKDDAGDLVIKMEDGSEYRVSYDNANDKLTFNGQLLAEKVDDFSFDLSDFSTNKYVEVTVKTGNDSRTFESRNTNTARNGDVTGNVAGDITATIIAPDSLIMEPCQSYVIPCSVMGVSNQNIVWTTSTPKAVVMGNTIMVDKNIDVDTFTVYGSTQALKKDMVTPAGTKSISVDVRKVTGYTFTHSLVSGNPLRNGATYRVEMNMTGVNLQKNLTKESDYVSPYRIKWTDSYTGGGGPSSAYQIIEKHDATESSPGYLVLKLKKDINMGDKIEIKGLVVHPEGKWPGESTQSNKSGSKYVGSSMSGVFTLVGLPFSYDGSKLYRGSDDPQLSFTAHDTLKNQLIAAHGNGNYRSKMFYRCRPVTLSGNTVTWAGSWTDWRQNPGDGDDSLSINLRPDATKQFVCDGAYEIEMMLTFWNDSTGHVYWPGDYQTYWGESTHSIVNHVIAAAGDPSSYTISDIMKPVTLSFNLKKGGTSLQSNVSALGSNVSGYELNKGTEYSLSYSSAEGIKTTLVKNNIQYVLEQYVGGSWREVMRYRNGENPFCFKLDSNGKILYYENNYSGKVNVNKDSKRFRIKIRGVSVQGTAYNAPGNAYPGTSADYNFYDESTGRGIFYINFK